MMHTRSNLRHGFVSALAIAVAACAADPVPEASQAESEGLVSTTNPATLPKSVGDLAPLTVHGAFSQTTPSGTYLANSGQYSRGDDLIGAPTNKRSTWLSSSTSPASLTPSDLAGYLNAALAAADADNTGLDAGALASLYELLTALGGVPSATHSTATTFQGYTPLRARWQSAQYEAGAVIRDIPVKGKMVPNAAPLELAEMRERGARLYCAAREVGFRQGSTVRSMGEQVAFSVKLLGHKIDFLVVEPLVTLSGPKAFTQTGEPLALLSDGAQAFEIPMGFGTRITPIRGLGLPGLREIRYPVELVTADAEGMTPAVIGTRADGTVGAAKQYMTAKHADAIQSAWETMHTGVTVPLFEAGALHVTLELLLDADVGRPLVPGSTIPLGVTAQPYDRVVVKEDMLPLVYGPTRPSYSPLLDGTRITNHDGAWTANTCHPTELNPHCPTWDWAVVPDSTSPLWETTQAKLGAMATRVNQDDDHVYRTRSALSLTGKVTGKLGFDRVGPFRVGLEVNGGINGTVGESHVLRDGVYAEKLPSEASMRGAAGISVRPRTDASASLIDTNAILHLSIHVPFYGDVHWDPSIFHIDPVTLASWDTDNDHAYWHESNELRVGTSSSVGNAMKKPAAHSHLPADRDIASFPTDVDACLADKRPNPSPAPLCAPEKPRGAPPRANTCAYFAGQFPLNVCSDTTAAAAFTGATGAQAACLTHYFDFLCQPVSHQEGGALLSHIVDLSDAATMSRLGNIMTECIEAYVPKTSADPAGDAKRFNDGFFRVGLCNESAQLLSAGDTLGPWDPSKAPSEPSAVTAPASGCR